EEISTISYEAVSKYPSVTRDMALLVNQTVTHQELVATIHQSGGRFLRQVQLFDVYEGANLGENHKSMAYSLTFLNSEATLTDEEITKALEKITKALMDQHQVEIR